MTDTDVSSQIGKYITYVGSDQFNIDYPVLYTYVYDERMLLCCEVDVESSYNDIEDDEPFLLVYIEVTSVWKLILHEAGRDLYAMISFDENGSDVW